MVRAGALAALSDHEVKSHTRRWQGNEREETWVPRISWHTAATPALDCPGRNGLLFTTPLSGAFCNSRPNLVKTVPEPPLSPSLSGWRRQRQAGQPVCSQGGLWAWCPLGARATGRLPGSHLCLSLGRPRFLRLERALSSLTYKVNLCPGLGRVPAAFVRKRFQRSV